MQCATFFLLTAYVSLIYYKKNIEVGILLVAVNGKISLHTGVYFDYCSFNNYY